MSESLFKGEKGLRDVLSAPQALSMKAGLLVSLSMKMGKNGKLYLVKLSVNFSNNPPRAARHNMSRFEGEPPNHPKGASLFR